MKVWWDNLTTERRVCMPPYTHPNGAILRNPVVVEFEGVTVAHPILLADEEKGVLIEWVSIDPYPETRKRYGEVKITVRDDRYAVVTPLRYPRPSDWRHPLMGRGVLKNLEWSYSMDLAKLIKY